MRKRNAVFLDLQGTLGGEGLGHILDFTFFPFAASAIRSIKQVNLLALIVTNQSKISKGVLSLTEYQNKMSQLQGELSQQDAAIDAVYCCPHIPADGCTCIKPLPGMLIQAQQDFDLDLSRCYVVGDMGSSDMVLSQAVGATGVLVLTGVGQSSLDEFRDSWADVEPDFIAPNVMDAALWISEQEAARAEVNH